MLYDAILDDATMLLYYTILCYAMLCYAMLCYAMLFYTHPRIIHSQEITICQNQKGGKDRRRVGLGRAWRGFRVFAILSAI